MPSRTIRLALSTVALAALATACGGRVCSDFSADYAPSGGDQNAGAAPPGGSANGGAPSEDGARAVEEADVVQVDGGRLYALGRTTGLSIVDVSGERTLALLGRTSLAGIPFEMYRRGDVLLVMSNAALDAAGGELATPAKLPPAGTLPNGHPAPVVHPYGAQLVALDVRNPTAPVRLASFPIAGEIADSRIVGDALYVVSYESGACWQCDGGRRTVISSFDVTNPTAIARVDHRDFPASGDDGDAWQRSVASGANKLFVGSNEALFDDHGRSTQGAIDVIDVSDPHGHLVVGERVKVHGQILSRWQMDERDGVLRVVSQRDTARLRNGSGEPMVETFQLAAGAPPERLGSTSLHLKQQEGLKSVRFDGERAYAITFRNTDPLFTIDLADPHAPAQKAELKVPGFVHHIEPRGDRLIALGVEQNASSGQLNVSLFDVADLASPRMIDRVAFGATGGLADLTEDQNRIHKAFRVFDEHGLAVVPFTSHFERNYGVTTCNPSRSGIQLVGLRRDGLDLHALLDIPGTPRRALVHDGRLLAVSETNVRAYSLLSRDSSEPLADLSVAACTVRTTSPQEGSFYGANLGSDVDHGYGGSGGCD